MDMIKSLAAAVKQPPYAMTTASDELLKWIAGEEVMTEPLDVSYCQFDLKEEARSAAVVREAAGGGADEEEEEQAVGLEPAMGIVRIRDKRCAAPRQREHCRPPSNKARFVHDMAASLVKDAHMSWATALKEADQSWAALKESGGVEAEPDAAGSDVEPVLDVEGPGQSF